MTRFALKGLAARKLRSLLTMVAIVLGVAMVSGTYVLTDTIEKAFDQIFTRSYDNTDAVVTGTKSVEWSGSGRPTVPESFLVKVRALPEVEAASGNLLDFSGEADQAQLLDKQGKAIQNGNPTFGFGIDPTAERFNPFELAQGRWATGPGEVVIDAETANKYGYAVGERIGVAAQGPVERFRIVGIARFGDLSSYGGATIALFTIDEAQRIHAKEGFDAIAVAAKDGVSAETLIDRIAAIAPQGIEVRTGAEQAEEDKAGIDEFISFLRYFLLGFGGVALFVGAFVIFNTLSITVAQRTRELATLRTLGASRRQVLRSVVIEGLALGVIGSLIGLAAGVLLANGLSALFSALNLQLPEADMVFKARTAIVPLVLGAGITLFASLVPAIRATRVPAIAAVREGSAAAGHRPSKKLTAVAILVAGAAGTALSYGILGGGVSAGQRVAMIVIGTLGVFVGFAMLAPRLVRPLAAVVGQPSARFGGSAGRLARENAIRNPGRTAATAAALMIGLTLVTFVSVLGKGLIGSGKDAVVRQLHADYLVASATGWQSVPVEAGRTVAKVDGVQLASSVRFDRAQYRDGSEIDVSGVDPRTIADLYAFEWQAGSDAAAASLGARDALVRDQFAEDKGLSVGEPITFVSAAGEQVTAVVRGIYSPPEMDSLLGHVVLAHSGFDTAFANAGDAYTLVRAESSAAVERAVAGFPAADVQTPDEFADARYGWLSDVMNLLYVLLALSVIVSLFGMVNTLVLAVFERTRELGMMRAVGMTRRQVRRMIRHEGVITALIGAGIGIPLGIALAALVIQSLEKYGVVFSVPAGTLVAFTVVTVIAGMLAAVLPARRAARLNVLKALQYE